MCLRQVSLADSFGSLIGHLVVTSSGALNCDVDISLNCDYFGTIHKDLTENLN